MKVESGAAAPDEDDDGEEERFNQENSFEHH
jgi:hypothetical protein